MSNKDDNKYDRDFCEVGISPLMYKQNEEEEHPEVAIFDFSKKKTNTANKTNQEEEKTTCDIEEDDDQFRHQSIIINDNQFIHSKNIESIKDKESFSYYKSDYFYASYVDEPQENKINKIDFTTKEIISKSKSRIFYRLFGLVMLKLSEGEDFLNNLIKNKESISKPEESESIWKKINLRNSHGEEIQYQNINLKDCQIGNDEQSIINWILAFHNYGVDHHIYFTFTVFNIEEENYKCSTFSVGKNYPRNRCFVTFIKNADDNYEPFLLSLIVKTKRTKIEDQTGFTGKFYSISNIFWLLTDGANQKIAIPSIENENGEFQNWEALYYKITSKKREFDLHIKQKSNNQSNKKNAYEIVSVNRLNCFFHHGPDFYLSFHDDIVKNFYPDARIIPKDEATSQNNSLAISTTTPTIATIEFKNSKEKLSLKYNEYQIYVGLNGIKIGEIKQEDINSPPFSSHITIFSYLKLHTAFVDENMDKIYCVFTEDKDKNLRLVESDFGTTKLDDMKTVKKLNIKVKDPKFKVNICNQLILIPNSDNETNALKQDKNDGSWKEFEVPKDENYFLKPTKYKNDMKIFLRYTLPIALEISNKLFVMNTSTKLYHPAWRNCILRDSIISTFYRFAYHMVPDTIVFEKNLKKDKSEVVSAIIYPQIDIGFQGNIRKLYTSTVSPGIYEYCDRAFNYSSLKGLLPYTKTDCLFFNNGNLKVGLDRHRTKCQIAATALFGFACSIYGPGMLIRDFLIGKGNPYSAASFQMIHNFLIAAYGTFLKMENEEEFQFAIDVICEELDIKENRVVYDNLMKELKKNYYI